MSKKFGLLSSLNSDKPTKQQYQIFAVEIGFEKFEIAIPLEEADAFEKSAIQAQPRTKTGLDDIVDTYKGHIL